MSISFDQDDATGFLRLPEVLRIIPIGRSTWWQGIKEGRYPRAIKLGPRTTAWSRADIFELAARLKAESSHE